jgi:CO dehydrogenase maturation factor
MKLAISGKGGTGKTTLAGLLAYLFKADGYQVLAVDADPDANLASALGIPPAQADAITPISRHKSLIQERTGATPSQFGQMFKLNPEVKDIPERFFYDHSGIKLLVFGAVEKGGGGCACPENVFLRSLLSEIILNRNEVVIVDMEAGIEHLGRAVTRSIDMMLIVVEPGSRSVATAKTIIKLAHDIGISSFGIIGNKVQTEEEKQWIADRFLNDLNAQGMPHSVLKSRPNDLSLLGTLSYSETIHDADLKRLPLIDAMDDRLRREIQKVYSNITDKIVSKSS